MIKYFSFLLFPILVFAQISPGELTTAHASLEGLSNCTKCHVLGDKVTDQKCLDCHKEIGALINEKRGYHNSAEVKNKECINCHGDHFGRNFQIVKFDEKKFDHSKSGYELKAAHDEIKCGDCHTSKNIFNPELKKRKKTFLGLEQKCISCHEDYHQKTLGDDCGSCHLTEDFKKAELFDHNKTKFKLAGAHLKTDCNDCHKLEKRNGKDFRIFKGVHFASCEDCHRDVHNGKFGKDCAKCHSVVSFKQINESQFDHSKTNYPLIGLHKQVECKDCHKEKVTAKLKFTNCSDCHKDYHKSEFTVNGQIKKCDDCHNEFGFTPSTYTIEKHQASRFPLAGAHFAIPCRDCHYDAKLDVHKFRFEKMDCIVCHKNVHGDELRTELFNVNLCEECHSTENWKQINFKHERTNFKLIGKHEKIPCNDCHLSKDEAKQYLFKSVKKSCNDCHTDAHNNQFLVEGKTDCARCHDSYSWYIEKFDHDKSRFKLDGAHSRVECAKCHRAEFVNDKKIIDYKFEDISCISCHKN